MPLKIIKEFLEEEFQVEQMILLNEKLMLISFC